MPDKTAHLTLPAGFQRHVHGMRDTSTVTAEQWRGGDGFETAAMAERLLDPE
jgi:hypothetical protein